MFIDRIGLTSFLKYKLSIPEQKIILLKFLMSISREKFSALLLMLKLFYLFIVMSFVKKISQFSRMHFAIKIRNKSRVFKVDVALRREVFWEFSLLYLLISVEDLLVLYLFKLLKTLERERWKRPEKRKSGRRMWISEDEKNKKNHFAGGENSFISIHFLTSLPFPSQSSESLNNENINSCWNTFYALKFYRQSSFGP